MYRRLPGDGTKLQRHDWQDQGKGHSLYNGTLMQWGIHTEKRNGSGEDEGQDWCRGRVRA
ncbi:uncharacterized protein ANIA_11420 [Aspergillus nidulans FGSC A4]|uniref:Uncharacterized protein n=1 Tax=Emericella nidulans (strain FGSC A4 / ATCC 38163 / CBS 112.46 / NRRL 194 / M139) TaxID=227321 RepID=C8V634_EMENI|nr:hypothetical protein [Aspergillus nidulans FGSC A4]CBF75044.1 TPA: hypothetical protein ANIA_11420 [Aspergillus nidulans FGSC A4]